MRKKIFNHSISTRTVNKKLKMYALSDQKRKNKNFSRKVLTKLIKRCIVSVISNRPIKVMIGNKDKRRVLESRCLVQADTKPY